MNRKTLVVSVAVFTLACLGLTQLSGKGREKRIRASLSGYQEVPAVSTSGHGEFRGKIDASDTELSYELEYADMEGTVTQAHIHFGQRSVNGGISIFLCSNLGNGPAGTPACPVSGMVSRTVTASDVVGPNGQGIAPTEFAEILEAIRSDVAYANVHSTTWTGGEIRGQINDEDRH